MKMHKMLLSVLIIASTFSTTLLAKEVVVTIYKKAFTPATVTINAGDTVIWKNIEKRQYHNVWFKQFSKEEPDYLFPGESFQHTFTAAGEYAYLCGPHPKMTGVVTVIASPQ